jgi:transglutaminase-like putative cysteine protease
MSGFFNNVDYVPGSDASTSAYDTLNQREVCKDFAHLGIALCKALSIPSRYFTCYATNINPPDIHACFEVYWRTMDPFDPTHLSNLSSLVKMHMERWLRCCCCKSFPKHSAPT